MVAVVPQGCSDSITQVVTVNANPKSNFTYILNGSEVDLKATQVELTKYQWKFGNTDRATTSVVNFSHSIKTSDQYNVCLKVTDAAECNSESCKKVSVGISTLTKSSGIKIYPNPNTGIFAIEIGEPKGELSIEIYNQIGQIIYKSEGSLATLNIDLNLAVGLYLVKAENNGILYNQRIIVKK